MLDSNKSKLVVSKGIFGWTRLKFYVFIIISNFIFLFILFIFFLLINNSDSWIVIHTFAKLIFILLVLTIIGSVGLIIWYEVINWNKNKTQRFLFLIYLLFWVIVMLIISAF